MDICAGMMWLIPLSLLLIGLFIVGGFLFLSHSQRNATPGEKRKINVEDILQERLARGEIDPDEYRERLNAFHNPR